MKEENEKKIQDKQKGENELKNELPLEIVGLADEDSLFESLLDMSGMKYYSTRAISCLFSEHSGIEDFDEKANFNSIEEQF